METASDGKVVISTELDNSGLEKSTRSTVATLAAQYRKAGMSQSDAMKKAWSEVEHTSKKSSEKVNKHIQSMGKATQKVAGAFGGLGAVLGKLGSVIGAAFAVHKAIEFGTESVKAANQLKDALTGLRSVVEGQGRSFKQAQKFIDEYTADGLVPATNAINAYKNLSLRGYDDSQIRQVMIALKDSAAFGRQANYTMGEAVQSATEGLKNENSILVDNAGVTKNVAKMWDDYARSIGTTANNLTQQQKIQAEVNGILEESKYQAGDAAKVAGTFSGQLMQLSFNFNNLKVAVGNAIIPVASKILPIINAMIAAFTRLANAVATVIGAVFGKAQVQGNAMAAQNEQVAASAGAGAAAEDKLAQSTKKAGKAAKGALASFDELNVLQKDTGSGGVGDVGGTGGISAGSVPITAEMTIEDTLSPQIQAIVDKVHTLLEPLRQIDFGPLVAAFGRLKEALAPLTHTLFAGLEWAYYNIFVPLAAWTVEDFLPAFLDVLAGACRVLTAALETLAPLGQWLWDGFLGPIAVWTGGVIIEVLDLLADALNAVADWIINNQELIQGFARIILAMAGAWKLANGAITVWNGLVTTWTTISGLAKAGVAQLGKAFAFLAANPIALVIAAIVALVALIAVKGDEIKALIQKLDDWLQEIFVKDWTEVFGNKLGTILNIFFAELKGVWDGIKQIFDGIIDFIRGVFTGDWERVWDGVAEIFAGIFGTLEGIAKAPINGIIAMLNSAIGAFNNLILGLNKIKIDIPEWIPGVGGKTFGINIPRIPNIPMLAQGAVLPANKPFLAMVGDQKNGTNIEAPLDTIKEALAEVLGQQGAQEIIIKFAASGGIEQLVRLLKPYIDRETNRAGTKLITGGVY